jgi:hypothetical protein
MGLTQILILVGAVAVIILAIVAVRGFFRNDDEFYEGSTIKDGRPTNDPVTSQPTGEGPGEPASDNGEAGGGPTSPS